MNIYTFIFSFIITLIEENPDQLIVIPFLLYRRESDYLRLFIAKLDLFSNRNKNVYIFVYYNRVAKPIRKLQHKHIHNFREQYPHLHLYLYI